MTPRELAEYVGMVGGVAYVADEVLRKLRGWWSAWRAAREFPLPDQDALARLRASQSKKHEPSTSPAFIFPTRHRLRCLDCGADLEAYAYGHAEVTCEASTVDVARRVAPADPATARRP